MVYRCRKLCHRFKVDLAKSVKCFLHQALNFLICKQVALHNKSKILYPFDEEGKLWFSKLMFPEVNSGYCAQLYKERFTVNEGRVNHRYLATEILYVKRNRDKTTIRVDGECLLPVAISDNVNKSKCSNPTLSIFVNGEEKKVSGPVSGKYYYFKISQASDVQIVSVGRDIFLGNPLYLSSPVHGPKLVLPIFIDGLAYDFFKFRSFADLMPNTYNFFSKGTIFHNCHSNGEWSIPGIAAMFTGLKTQHHGMFHPRSGQVLDQQNIILSEVFQKQGYFTAQICSNWRKNPSLGYARGFDRTVYRREMDCSEAVTEFLSVAEGFGQRNMFVWLTLFDLHHRFYHVPTIDVSSKIDLEMYCTKSSQEKSVRKEYDEDSIKCHCLELERIDRHLGFVYDFITRNYQDEEILVALMSDHGMSFLSDDPHILADKRIRVPLMLRGRSVDQVESYEYVQNVDILPTLSHLAGFQESLGEIDGRLPKTFGGEKERDHIFTESLFPSQVYKSVFKGKEGRFVFESGDTVSEDGTFDRDSIFCVSEPDGGLIAGKDVSCFRNTLNAYLATSCFNQND